MRSKHPLLVAALLALILAGCSEQTNNNSGVTDIPNADSQPTSTSSPAWMESTATASSEASPSSTTQPAEEQPAKPTEENQPSETSPDQQAELEDISQQVVEILRERDLKSLTQWIDPEQGLRFSPYPHINPDTDLVFKAEDVPSFKDSTKRKWGAADGSGDPIELTFRDYYDKFVYNHDFADAPNVSVNKIMGAGNIIFSAAEVYPNASYIEFHFPGFDKKSEGMDWQSLILVFVPSNQDWKLAAVVHGQWTI